MNPKRLKERVNKMVSTKIIYFILTTALISAATCRQQMPSEYKEFFDLPLPRQVEEFRRYPVSKQLDLYLYDWNYVHPSKVGFAYTIAERGEGVAPFLISSLNAEKNENSQDAIVHIFEIMFDRGFLKGREDILIVIRKVISNMSDPAIQQLSRERLSKIEKGSRS